MPPGSSEDGVVPSIFLETPLVIAFIRGLDGFVSGTLRFYLFSSSPAPSCFACYIERRLNPVHPQVGRARNPSGPNGTLQVICPIVSIRDLIQPHGRGEVDSGLISSQVSILELITVQEQVTPQMYH